MRPILIILFFLLTIVTVKSYGQKWQAGHFTDIKGNIQSGLIRINPPGRPPVKDEGFIEFKEDEKANAFKLSTSDLKSFVMGKDSFVAAHAPGNEVWGKHEYDFVKVVFDEDFKLYAAAGGAIGGGGSGFSIEPGVGVGTGIGTGGFGAGIGGGVSVPIGIGGGNRAGNTYKTTWYYGLNTAEMKPLTDENFDAIMSDIMGDYPDIVEKIRRKVYVLENIDRLIAYYKQLKKQF